MIDFDDAPTLHELTAAIMRRDAERRLWVAKRRAQTPRGQAIHVGKSKWTGMVERREPRAYQRPSVVLARRCPNRYCGQWMPAGSHDAGRCLICQTPF